MRLVREVVGLAWRSSWRLLAGDSMRPPGACWLAGGVLVWVEGLAGLLVAPRPMLARGCRPGFWRPCVAWSSC